MGRSVQERAADIIEAIRRITEDLDLIDTVHDRTAFDAIVRNMITIGEAAAGIPTSSRELAPHIEWSKIVGLRNLATHEYFRLSRGIVLQIAADDLDELRCAAEDLQSS